MDKKVSLHNTLLDLSDAFDTYDSSIITTLLSTWYVSPPPDTCQVVNRRLSLLIVHPK